MICECGGKGVIVSEFTARECVCSFARSLKTHLGPLVSAANLKRSDLSLDHRLWMTAPWSLVEAHLKYLLTLRGLEYRFAILSDEALKGLYLADATVLRKKIKDGDNPQSMSEAVSTPDFIVIRTGVLGYKNVAMPGILLEALQIRLTSKKPVWVVDHPDLSLRSPKHLCHSPALIEFLSSFQEVSPSSELPGEVATHPNSESIPEVRADPHEHRPDSRVGMDPAPLLELTLDSDRSREHRRSQKRRRSV